MCYAVCRSLGVVRGCSLSFGAEILKQSSGAGGSCWYGGTRRGERALARLLFDSSSDSSDEEEVRDVHQQGSTSKMCRTSNPPEQYYCAALGLTVYSKKPLCSRLSSQAERINARIFARQLWYLRPSEIQSDFLKQAQHDVDKCLFSRGRRGNSILQQGRHHISWDLLDSVGACVERSFQHVLEACNIG